LPFVDAQTATIRADIRAVAAGSSAIVPLFASTMFLSGFLLFLVEPMTAKMVLPILGGVPMVWNSCVVFFQVVMLAGYAYAFLASRSLTIRQQVLVHACVLAAPTVALPFMIESGLVTPPPGNPLPWLMWLLTLRIGLPFFALATSASVFQHWLSRTDHPAAGDPYFLYSASNHGCLTALAAYPVIIEPLLTLREQTRFWALGYVALVALAGGCGIVAWRRATKDATDPATVAAQATRSARAAVTASRRIRWITLAFVPSSLMLAVTSYLSTDIAAVPLLWIVPLAIYLTTFALAFGRRSQAAFAASTRAVPLLVVPLVLFMLAGVREPLALLVLLHLGGFGAIALYCHGKLARDRPDAWHLTEFYVWVSVGGMAGGLLSTLVAPVIFRTIGEYPLVLMLGCLLFRAPGNAVGAPRSVILDVALPMTAGGLAAAVLIAARTGQLPLSMQIAGLSIPALLAFTQRRSPGRFGLSLALMLASGLAFSNSGGRVLYEARTFFGVYRVTEDPTGRYHGLAHGTTLHGMQALAPERRAEALTYYHATGPFGQAWRALPGAAGGRAIGVIGLGVGTLATYATPAQRWTFFEIDPAIERIARDRSYFTFMDACGDRCRVVIGDARLSLGRVAPRSYDLLVLDAFSSDAIPIHLMTREALELYLSRLGDGGALLLHVSNRHLSLAPVVARLAESEGLIALQQVEVVGPTAPPGKSSSHWIAMARTRADLGALAADDRWRPLAASDGTPLWTDDFSNILSVLRIR
jgi:hypothetical protein